MSVDIATSTPTATITFADNHNNTGTFNVGPTTPPGTYTYVVVAQNVVGQDRQTETFTIAAAPVQSATATATASSSASATPTATTSASATPTATTSPSATPTATTSPSATATATVGPTGSPTAS